MKKMVLLDKAHIAFIKKVMCCRDLNDTEKKLKLEIKLAFQNATDWR